MNNEHLARNLADIHNLLADIPVRGDDVLKLADAIRGLRGIVQNLLEENEQENSQEKEGDDS